MKQISMQITDETARQMADLAVHWGLPRVRHNTAVVERAVALAFMLEVGYERYQQRIAEVTKEDR
jgi:glycine/serine hydroxymethyltransferase